MIDRYTVKYHLDHHQLQDYLITISDEHNLHSCVVVGDIFVTIVEKVEKKIIAEKQNSSVNSKSSKKTWIVDRGMPGYLNVHQICKKTDLKLSTLNTYITQNIFPKADKKDGYMRFWKEETIEKWLKNRDGLHRGQYKKKKK